MDIRSINSGLNPAEIASRRRAEDAEGAQQGAAATEKASESSAARDAVSLSRSSTAEASREMGLARAALQHAPGLSDARRAEIQARIESGFYTNPEVTAQVADRMADELKGGAGS